MNPTLLEYFAAHETLEDLDADDVVFPAETAEKMAGPKPVSWEDVGAWEWNAKWRAKLRFIRARAMAEEAERIRAESVPKDQVFEMVHPLFGALRWDDYVEPVWSRVRAESNANATTPPKTSNLSFCEALEAMKQGKSVKRSDWDDGSSISKSGDPLDRVTIHSILAEDWEILP